MGASLFYCPKRQQRERQRMTQAAVADPPKTGTDTGANQAAPNATPGKDDTGASANGAGTDVQVQTGAKPEDTTKAAASDADPSKADAKADPDPNAETPDAKLKREAHEAEVQAAAKALRDQERDEEAKNKAVEDKEKAANDRKTARSQVKGAHTRALTSSSKVLEDAGVDEEVIERALNPFKGHNLQFGKLIDNEFEAAIESFDADSRAAIKAAMPKDAFEAFDKASADVTDLGEFFKLAVEHAAPHAGTTAEHIAKLPLDDYLKANPAAKAAVLKERNDWGDTRFDEGLNTHRGQPGAGGGGEAAASEPQNMREVRLAHTKRQITTAQMRAYQARNGRGQFPD